MFKRQIMMVEYIINISARDHHSMTVHAQGYLQALVIMVIHYVIVLYIYILLK